MSASVWLSDSFSSEITEAGNEVAKFIGCYLHLKVRKTSTSKLIHQLWKELWAFRNAPKFAFLRIMAKLFGSYFAADWHGKTDLGICRSSRIDQNINVLLHVFYYLMRFTILWSDKKSNKGIFHVLHFSNRLCINLYLLYCFIYSRCLLFLVAICIKFA